MKFTQIIAPSMKELFVNQIETLILAGKLKIGEKLPTERELAEQMKISRTIVNLGLSELSCKGFVEIIPRQGTFVQDYARYGNLDTLLAIMNYNGGKFDKNTANSIMQFRLINEGEGTYLAALNRKDEDVEKLRNIIRDCEIENDSIEIAKMLFNFHHLILCASGNNIFPLVYNAFESFFINLISSLINEKNKMYYLDDLSELVDAIDKKDANLSKELICSLIKNGIKSVNVQGMLI